MNSYIFHCVLYTFYWCESVMCNQSNYFQNSRHKVCMAYFKKLYIYDVRRYGRYGHLFLYFVIVNVSWQSGENFVVVNFN